MAIVATDLAPEAFLQVAGHPLRWRLLGDLARSDRTVRELTASVGEPQNLVSYHLGKLRAAGLVTGRRSSADGRDTYYTADLPRLGDLLASTGGALHPGLRLVAPPPAGATSGTPRGRVLFLCTGNSARSPIAAALSRLRSGGAVDAYSAGSRPKPLHPDAERVLAADYGIDLAGHQPTHLRTYARRRFDRVITLCDKVREVCPEFPGHPRPVHWSIPDPVSGHEPGDEAGYSAFQQVAAELDTRVGFLLADLPVTTTRS